MRIVLAGVFTVFLLVWALPSKAAVPGCSFVEHGHGGSYHCDVEADSDIRHCAVGQRDTGVALCYTIGADSQTQGQERSPEPDALMLPVRIPAQVRDGASPLALAFFDILIVEDVLLAGRDMNGVLRFDDAEAGSALDGELAFSGHVSPRHQGAVLEGRFVVQADGETLETIRFDMALVESAEAPVAGIPGVYEFRRIQ